MNWDFIPPFLNDLALFVEIHFPTDDFTEQTFPSLCHDGHVIRALG
jgi:hypothetical protein